MICKWNTFTVHWHFVDLYIVHTAGRVWTIQVTVYTMEIEPRGYSIFNLLVYLFFTYIHKGTTKWLLTEFLSNCIDVSSELWSYSEKLVYVAYLLFFLFFFFTVWRCFSLRKSRPKYYRLALLFFLFLFTKYIRGTHWG